ncbi:hypothetical protein GCM10009602_49230 [Nocardiopsis tropica]
MSISAAAAMVFAAAGEAYQAASLWRISGRCRGLIAGALMGPVCAVPVTIRQVSRFPLYGARATPGPVK